MPLEIITQRIGNLESLSHSDQVQLINHLNGLVDGIRALTAKLDADAGVTDTNYTATFDALYKKSV